MLEAEKISAMLPKSGKKSFNKGIIIPPKMRFCNECNDKRMCIRCKNQFIEKKIRSFFIIFKKTSPNELGIYAYFSNE